MTAIGEKTKVQLQLGAALAALIFVIGATWRAAIWMSEDEAFKRQTSESFVAIKDILRTMRSEVTKTQGDQEAMREAIKTLSSDRWKGSEMLNWSIQFERENRAVNRTDGKLGLSVPDVKPANLGVGP